jgi:hypothetical protein
MAIKDPVVIDSPLSGEFTRDCITVEVCIYRLENSKWTLEVVDASGTSHMWDDEFESDHAARIRNFCEPLRPKAWVNSTDRAAVRSVSS